MHRSTPERPGPPEPSPEVIERSLKEHSRRQEAEEAANLVDPLEDDETTKDLKTIVASNTGRVVMGAAMPVDVIDPVDKDKKNVDAERRSSQEFSFRGKMIEALTPVAHKLGEAYEAARMSEQQQIDLLNNALQVKRILDNESFGYHSGDPLTPIRQLDASLEGWTKGMRRMAEQAGGVVQSGRFVKGKFDEVGGLVEHEKREKSSTGSDNQLEEGNTLSFDLPDDQAGEQMSAEAEKDERGIINEVDNLVGGAYDAVVALGSDSIEISLQDLPRRLEPIKDIIGYMYGDYRRAGVRSLENNLPDLKRRLSSFIEDLESTRVATSQKKVALEGLSQHIASFLENLKAGEGSES